ncbi:uncharacterized protein LOC144909424 isoform X1 [Branchiostoma floridae x Branchiostoma belcheri]
MVEIAIRLELQETFSTKEDAVCAVCLEETKKQQTTTLECSHVYHSECITKWQKINPTCPKCRAPVIETLFYTCTVYDLKYVVLFFLI